MESPTTDEPNDDAWRTSGDWTMPLTHLAVELELFLATARRPDVPPAPTRCEPWTGDQLVAHVAATFQRFNEMLTQSRDGDLSAPFERDGLHQANQEAVETFSQDPPAACEQAARKFFRLIEDPNELMAHQLGPIPVAVQAAFGLSELMLHHHDLLSAVGEFYSPSPGAPEAVVRAWTSAFHLPQTAKVWNTLLDITDRA